MFSSSFASSYDSHSSSFPMELDCHATDFLIIPKDQEEILNRIPGWEPKSTESSVHAVVPLNTVQSAPLMETIDRRSVIVNSSDVPKEQCKFQSKSCSLKRSSSLPDIFTEVQASESQIKSNLDSNIGLSKSVENINEASENSKEQSDFKALLKFRSYLANTRTSLSKVRQSLEKDKSLMTNDFEKSSLQPPINNKELSPSVQGPNLRRKRSDDVENNFLHPKKLQRRIFGSGPILVTTKNQETSNLNVSNAAKLENRNSAIEEITRNIEKAIHFSPLAASSQKEIPEAEIIDIEFTEPKSFILTETQSKGTEVPTGINVLDKMNETYVINKPKDIPSKNVEYCYSVGEETQDACMRISSAAFTSSDSSVSLAPDDKTITSPSSCDVPKIAPNSQGSGERNKAPEKDAHNDSGDLFGSIPEPLRSSTQVPKSNTDSQSGSSVFPMFGGCSMPFTPQIQPNDDNTDKLIDDDLLTRVLRHQFNLPEPVSTQVPTQSNEKKTEKDKIFTFTPLQIKELNEVIFEMYK